MNFLRDISFQMGSDDTNVWESLCNDWSEASGFTCSKMFIEQRQKQTGNGQQAKTGISEAEQRRKQYQAGVEVTGTGSEFQGQAVQGQTQRWQEE